MPGNNYELSDVSHTYKQDSLSGGEAAPRRQEGGMYVSTAKAFILAFLAIAIAVGVGLIVHFAGPANEVECTCTYPTQESGTGGSTAALEQCKDWASDGNTDICSACPTPTQTPCPTSPTTTAAPMTSPPVTSPPVTTKTSTQTTTEAPTTAPPAVIDVRLPLDLDPVLYTVELQPHMYTDNPDDFFFEGKMTLLLQCKRATNNITLHTNKLNYTGDFTVTANGGNSVNVERHEFDMDRQFVVIHVTPGLEPGRNYTLNVPYFRGPLIGDLAGLYLSSYSRDNRTIYIATTQMQPTDARKTFPCMDEPAVKSMFDVTLVYQRPMKAISNMPVASSEDRADGWIADRFETTPRMSTYLLAFIICDFNYTTNTTANNVTYNAWSRPEAIDQTPYSLRVGVDILDYFEDYFNVTYPLPKQDMIAIPDFAAGAMENWGLITYRETAMLYEPGVSSEGNKQRVAVVVSHELAHQWFGNLVTPSWWDDLWLNEGFASYVEYMGVDFVHPDWKMFEQFVVEDLQDVFNFDGLISSHPVYVPVSHPDEINEIFDRISYAKGASIIRMMKFFLGETTFKHGLTNYLRDLAYGAAFHDDLWYHLGNQSATDGGNLNVKDIMDTWTLQMNYPVVHVRHAGGQVTVTQKRYLQDYNATDPGKYTSPFGYNWEIPFTFFTNQNPEKANVSSTDVTWFHRNQNELTISDVTDATWIVGNAMQYGYYRVNYDDSNWNALIAALTLNHTVIHPINRAQIVNDAWSLARSGDLSMTIALKTTNFLHSEREYIVWTAANAQLSYVSSMLARHPLYGAFSAFMQNKTSSVFAEITMNNTGATHLESYLRSTITGLACNYGITVCLVEAKRLFDDWMNTGTNRIDPGIKSTVYCQGVAQGGIREWEFVLEQYRSANLAAEQSRLLSALSCTKQVWILSRYLEMTIDPEQIRRQDAVSVMVQISRNTIGRSLAWDFFRSKWDFLLNEFGKSSFSFPKVIKGVTEAHNSQLLLAQLEDFIRDKPDLGSGARAFDQALEKTRSNINWMTTNVPIIESWLSEQGFQ